MEEMAACSGPWQTEAAPPGGAGASTESTLRLLPVALIACSVLGFGPALTARAAPVVVPVSSTFDSDLDGWIQARPTAEWRSTGGNPGGYFWSREAAPGRQVANAPGKFLGDWTALDNAGFILFDQRVIESGNPSAALGREVFLNGAGGDRAVWTGPLPCGTPDCSTPWERFVVPIESSSWAVTGSWSALLSDVAGLGIAMDLYPGGGGITGLDNVRLVPEPGTALLLGGGLLVLGLRRR